MVAYTNYRSDPRVIRAAEAATAAGFFVDFLCLRRGDESEAETIRGVRLLRLNQVRYRGGGLLRYMLAYLEFFVRCLCKTTFLFLRHRYRVIHVNNIPDFLVFSAIIPRMLGARILLDIHDPMPNTFSSKFKSGEDGLFFKLLLWQEKISAHFAHRVLTVHEPVKQAILVGQHGLPEKEVEVIANFPDDSIFQLRDSYSATGAVRMVFHGTILERYGLRTAIAALEAVRDRSQLSLRIIGEGDFSSKLKQLIAERGLHDCVEFINQAFPVELIPAMIADCNLGFVPLERSSMTHYGLPLKMLEYIALGLPVITVRNAAISYYFCEEDCLFYESNDAESLRRLFERVLAEPELLTEYHRRSVALRSRFIWSGERTKYTGLLRRLAFPDGSEAADSERIDVVGNGMRKPQSARVPLAR